MVKMRACKEVVTVDGEEVGRVPERGLHGGRCASEDEEGCSLRCWPW